METGEFCRFQDGEHGCNLEGVCEPVPRECSSACRPVCGCDGVSYRNECEAQAAGASIERRGMCRQVPDVHFVAADAIAWGSVPGATAFHLYRCEAAVGTDLRQRM